MAKRKVVSGKMKGKGNSLERKIYDVRGDGEMGGGGGGGPN